MYTQFFGNYLLSRDIISKEQLFDAMQKQASQRIRLGTLAISDGLMTAEEVDTVVIQQTHEDKKFGELAIELGYLSNAQVMELLKKQTPDFLLLGQILVDDGVLSYSDLESLINDYRTQNEMIDLDMTADNDNIVRLFENFFIASETPITKEGRMFLELLFNNFIRFIGEDFTPLTAEECHEFPIEYCVKQEVLGDYSIASYLSMDEATAIEFASRYVGEPFAAFDEYVQASLEDFLNLHNGLFIVNLSNEFSMELELSAPERIEDPLIVFENTAYYFPILYSFGTVNFIFELKKI